MISCHSGTGPRAPLWTGIFFRTLSPLWSRLRLALTPGRREREKLLRCAPAGQEALAAAALELVTRMAEAEDPGTRKECAAQLLDTWAKERELWASTVEEELSRKSVGSQVALTECLLKLVDDKLREWDEEDLRIRDAEMATEAAAETETVREHRARARELLVQKREEEVVDAQKKFMDTVGMCASLDILRGKLQRLQFQVLDFKIVEMRFKVMKLKMNAAPVGHERPASLEGISMARQEDEEEDGTDRDEAIRGASIEVGVCGSVLVAWARKLAGRTREYFCSGQVYMSLVTKRLAISFLASSVDRRNSLFVTTFSRDNKFYRVALLSVFNNVVHASLTCLQVRLRTRDLGVPRNVDTCRGLEVHDSQSIDANLTARPVLSPEMLSPGVQGKSIGPIVIAVTLSFKISRRDIITV